jgi:pheromone shutdown protein TraB
LFYASAFERSSPGEYTAVKILTAWTQRNLRIASNIWNMPKADDERVLVVFGASHVPQLGQMLTGAPMMAPVSPLPYLAADEGDASSFDS